jgi:hypothetical protein
MRHLHLGKSMQNNQVIDTPAFPPSIPSLAYPAGTVLKGKNGEEPPCQAEQQWREVQEELHRQ